MKAATGIRAMIVDDEMPARENLRMMLEAHCPEIQVVAMADGVPGAKLLFAERRPELLFLDIRMPSGAEGFELLHDLKGERFFVVFVTAFKEYAIQAFEYNALHYILKPIDDRDLRSAVDRIASLREMTQKAPETMDDYLQRLERLERELLSPGDQKLLIHHQKGVKVVQPRDISHLQGSGNCAILHFNNGEQYLDTRTLKTYENLLSARFFRVHKSYIVNLDEVEEVASGTEQVVKMRNGSRLPVARDARKGLIEALARR